MMSNDDKEIESCFKKMRISVVILWICAFGMICCAIFAVLDRIGAP